MLSHTPFGPSGAIVVVTTFECSSFVGFARFRMLYRVLAWRIRRSVAVQVDRTSVDWSERRLTSISLWKSFEDMLTLGDSHHHVSGSRLVLNSEIQTTCELFSCQGDWRAALGLNEERSDP